MPPSSPGRSRLAVAAGALVFALLLAEVIVRVFVPLPRLSSVFEPVDDPRLLYAPRPGASYSHEPHRDPGATPLLATMTIDTLGERTVPSGAGDPGCATIWIVGDSFAFGWGVSDDQTYAAALGDAVAPDLGCRPTVRNLGVNGYHLGQADRRLELALADARPSLVVLHLSENDGMADFNWVDPFGVPQFLVRHSRLANLAQLAALGPEFEKLEAGPGQTERWRSRVLVLRDRLEAAEVPVLVLLQPEVLLDARAHVEEALGTAVELQSCNIDPATQHLSARDFHYSPEGHACLTELLRPLIAARLGP